MTSGEFKSFPLAQIWVDREARQRRELSLTQIQELADSISRIGLIHPPVISRTGELRVGERRFEAMKLLGWTHTPVQFVEELSELELHILELEENLRRVDLTWQEECSAIADYHAMRAETETDWTVTKTADALGVSKQKVSEKIAVAEKLDNKKVAEAPRYSTALGMVRRQTERAKASLIAEIEERPAKSVPLINADFTEWVKSYDGPKFNFLHCDFPYGVSASKVSAESYGNYESNEEIYYTLLSTLESSMNTLVADSAHLIFWFSMRFYEVTRNRLTAMGWQVNPVPLIWHKSDNSGVLPDPTRGPRQVYEPAFLASRGDRKITAAVSNLISHPGRDKSIHVSEKPRPVLRHFMRMVVDEYTIMLDPTCGSGNSVATSEELGARTVLGIEKDVEFFNLAKESYYDVLA